MPQDTATIQEVQQALQDLINAEGYDIPGLDKETVLDYYVEEKYKNELSALDNDQEARNKEKERLKNYCRETMGNFFDYLISQAKITFQAVKDGVEQLKDSVMEAVTETTLPVVVVVGQATATNNPAYTASQSKQKKNNFKVMLKNLGILIAQLLWFFMLMCTPIPYYIMTIIQIFTEVKKLIETIP